MMEISLDGLCKINDPAGWTTESNSAELRTYYCYTTYNTYVIIMNTTIVVINNHILQLMKPNFLFNNVMYYSFDGNYFIQILLIC